MTKTTQQGDWLAFKVGNETFVIDIHPVRELICRRDVRPSYSQSEAVEGLTLYRGEALCVISGAVALKVDYPRQQACEKGFFVVLDYGSKSYALAVTELVDVLKYDVSAVTDYSWSSSAAVRGVVNHPTLGIMTMIDPLKLLEDIG